MSDAKQDIATVRRALIEIAGEDGEFDLYANVSFPDLVTSAPEAQGEAWAEAKGGSSGDSNEGDERLDCIKG